MTARRAFLALGLLLPGLAASAAGLRFEKRTVTLNDVTWPYEVFVPEGLRKDERPPVILFLHGAGLRGSGGEQTRESLGAAIRRDPARWPFLVVFPQCPKGAQWVDEADGQAFAALSAALMEFHGDRDRVSLVGVSMGGAATWWGAFRMPGAFAAIVPICGYVVPPGGLALEGVKPHDVRHVLGTGDPWGALASSIGTTPVWAFHGDADPVVPVTETRRLVAAIRRLGGSPTYTE